MSSATSRASLCAQRRQQASRVVRCASAASESVATGRSRRAQAFASLASSKDAASVQSLVRSRAAAAAFAHRARVRRRWRALQCAATAPSSSWCVAGAVLLSCRIFEPSACDDSAAAAPSTLCTATSSRFATLSSRVDLRRSDTSCAPQFALDVVVSGDVKISVASTRGKQEELFHFWFVAKRSPSMRTRSIDAQAQHEHVDVCRRSRRCASEQSGARRTRCGLVCRRSRVVVPALNALLSFLQSSKTRRSSNRAFASSSTSRNSDDAH